MTLWLSLVLWVALAALCLRSDSSFARAFKPRLVTLLAVILILGSYFFQAWLKFAVLDYFGSGLLRAVAPTMADFIGLETVSRLFQTFFDLVSLNGWQMQMVPFYGIGTRLAITIPALLAVMTLIWLPWGATLAGGRLCKVVGSTLVALSLLAVIGLTVALPDIDSLGAGERIDRALLAALLGTRVEIGVWLTLLGLLLMMVGGMVEIVEPGSRSPAPESSSLQPWSW